MGRQDALTLQLAPTAAAAGDGRRFVAGALRQWGMPDLIDVAVLLASELVTNAVLHAGTQVALTVCREPDGICVVVADGSSLLPRRSPGVGLATTGRGLQLVDALADSWSVEPAAEGPGKSVRFRLVTVPTEPRRW